MRKAVNSPALDKIVCFSSSEPAYYQSIFGTDKFTYVPLGLGDLNRGGRIPQGEERFILAAGKSNRDYDFLVDALKDTPYQYAFCPTRTTTRTPAATSAFITMCSAKSTIKCCRNAAA